MIDPHFLINLGLSADEADIYLSLLEHGPQTASKLGKTTKVKRTYVYRIATSLIQKGLVTRTKKDRTTVFAPNSPDFLLDFVRTNSQHLEQAKLTLENLLPSLKEKYRLVETKPVITYYEGVEGIKKVFKDIYAPKKEPVYGCVDLEKADEAVPGYIINTLIPLRIKNKVFAKSFIAKSSQAESIARTDRQSLRESLLLEKRTHPLPAEIDVYEDKVALLSFAKGQFTGVLIQNQDIATSLNTVFKLAFEQSKRS